MVSEKPPDIRVQQVTPESTRPDLKDFPVLPPYGRSNTFVDTYGKYLPTYLLV
jgi:hypothetical protein